MQNQLWHNFAANTAISLKEMIDIVSGFGSHLGLKGDSEVKVKTIWQGLLQLSSYVYSANIFNEINSL